MGDCCDEDVEALSAKKVVEQWAEAGDLAAEAQSEVLF